MSSIFSNNYKDFSYWFSETITDPNDNVTSDINKGIEKMIVGLIDELNNPDNSHEKFTIPETQVGMPDIVANAKYDNENMWWYLCLANLLDNPFVQYKNQMMYYAFDEMILEDHKIEINKSKNSQKSKIGTIVELN